MPQQDLNRPQWILSNWLAEAHDKHGISVISTQFFEHLEENPTLWDISFKKFHFLVCPVEQQNKKGNKYSYINELIFRDTWYQAWQLAHPTERERSLEIRGFQNGPVDIDVLLGHAAVVYLIDNPFIKFLSDLGVDKLKEMKVCWIERCNKMECVMMDAEKVSDTAKSGEQAEEMEILGDNLETLLISNATNLECIARGNLKNLKCLYLDCCPKVSEVFCLTQQFENLEVLEIKFCDKLERLFEHESAKLPKLQILHLRALPKLKRLGCMVPNLQSLQVGECPMLATVLSSSTPLLEILHIKSCDGLESVFEHSLSGSALPKLHELHMWELPVMKSIGVELPDLKDCSIRECPQLQGMPATAADSWVRTRSSII